MRLIVRGQLSERQLHKTSISFSRINSWTKQSTQNWHTQRKPKTKSIDRQFAWTIMPDREIKRGNGTQEHLRPPAEAGETSTVSSGTRYAKVRRSRSIDSRCTLRPLPGHICLMHTRLQRSNALSTREKDNFTQTEILCGSLDHSTRLKEDLISPAGRASCRLSPSTSLLVHQDPEMPRKKAKVTPRDECIIPVIFCSLYSESHDKNCACWNCVVEGRIKVLLQSFSECRRTIKRR